jgi:hypothetical protein
MTSLTRAELEAAADHALKMSEKRRNDARRRREQIHREMVQVWFRHVNSRRLWWQRLLRVSPYVNPRLVELSTDTRTSQDPYWKVAVADERWYGAQAVEYAALAALKPRTGE